MARYDNTPPDPPDKDEGYGHWSMYEEMSSGEEWKQIKKKFHMTLKTYYLVQYELCLGVLKAEHKASELERVVLDFRPMNKHFHDWLGECYDKGLDAWIDSDGVFRRINGDRVYLDVERESVFYRGCIDHAMRNGQWGPMYKAWAQELDRNAKSDK